MKVVINKCYGGFGVSPEGVKWLKEHNSELVEIYPYKYICGEKLYNDGKHSYNLVSEYDFEGDLRTHPDLIQMVEELGDKASGDLAELKIVEIPDNIKWSIQDYDGVEWIAEEHREWH